MLRHTRRSRRGINLAELMVYMMLLGLLMGGLYLVLVGGLRHLQRGTAYQTAQKEALVALKKMTAEMEQAKGDSSLFIYDNGANPYVVFLSGLSATRSGGPMNFNASGEVLWQKWVCYYYGNDAAGRGVVFRTEKDLTTPTATPAPPVPNITVMSAVPNGDRRTVVAHDISTLNFGPAISTSTRAVNVAIYATVETSSSQFTQIRFGNDLFMHN